ncbi:MAG: transglycosylase domain-containing protein [Clostridia bacterium]|nr:transglycosylase domain-containing protein [Clostridia bacterium]
MKKILKISLLILCLLILVVFSVFLLLNISLSEYKLDKNKLVDLTRTVNYYDVNGNLILEKSNGQNVVDFNEINDYTKNAFISIEDKRFYSHNGVDYKGVLRAVKNNLLSRSYKEGASTISQQLIKNTHLSSEKTIKRKFAELKLAKELEKNFTKDEILEKYLNTIYFGDNCYGISNASNHYFGKKASELTIAESAGLAGMIKAPSNYSPLNNFDKFNSRKNLVLKEMYLQEYLSKLEYENALKEVLNFKTNTNETKFDYFYLANKEYSNIVNATPYSTTKDVYTYYDPKIQCVLENTFQDFDDNFDKTVVITNKFGDVISYYSSCGERYRQIGSTIKPLLVYAPAIQENLVSEMTPLLDEKTDFNGYCPSNYTDKYYGYLSVKDSISKSSNVCAVKLLNSLTIEKAKKYLNKTDIQLTNNDNFLVIALGATEKGATLTQLAGAYNLFINNGNYTPTSCIKSYGKLSGIKRKSTKIFDDDVVYIMNDMLKSVVTNGTAKKLSYLDFDVYAKTGTVGDKNGNTDSYCISYTGDYVVAVWVGVKEKEQATNTLTGGGLPTIIAGNLLSEIYKNNTSSNITKPENVVEVKIDRFAYENDHNLVLADENAPERFTISGIFRNESIPKTKSTRFSKPNLEKPKTTVNQNEFIVYLCQTEYFDIKIFKTINDKKMQVFDSKTAIDKKAYKERLLPNNKYEFTAIPYFDNGKEIFYGEEIVLGKIKTPSIELGDWWLENL